MPNFFHTALPVWLTDLEKEKNITAGFYTTAEGTEATLKVATSGFYRVFVNGEFAAYGPARCAHGFFRVDEVTLPLSVGVNHVAVEVVNYYINSFASLMQPGFIQMELTINGAVVAATGAQGFTTYRLTERVRKMQRFSYQRPMGESYRLSTGAFGWRIGLPSDNAIAHTVTVTTKKALISRDLAPLTFPMATPKTLLSVGTFITDVKPEHYRKDRSLLNIGDPSKGELGGWPEAELELHLSDEVQEWQITSMVSANTPYSGETVLHAGEYAIFAMAKEKTGFIAAELSCAEESTLYIAVDETLRKNGDVDPISMECLNVVRMDMQPGDYPFQTVETFGFQYIKLACTVGTVTIKHLRLVELICPQPIVAKYLGNDPILAEIFDAAVETFKQNSCDIFMDCPTRERAGWLCDSYFTAKAEFALTGDNVVERAFLTNFRLPKDFGSLPKGMLPMCYPADKMAGEFIPNWAMWFVLELEDYVRRTGDKNFVAPFRDRVYDLLAYFKKFENNDGLLSKLDGWVFLEWSQANKLVQDINFPSNMLYARMLRATAALFDDPAQIVKAERLETVIRERSYDGQFFVDNEVYNDDGFPVSSGERTETCQYYAFFTGVATPKTYPELWQRLTTEFGPYRLKQYDTGDIWPRRENLTKWTEIWPSNAFIGNYLRLELLRQEGLYEQLLKECTGYFHYMAQRTGTLWENTSEYASCNHGFASYAAAFILEAEKHKNNEN